MASEAVRGVRMHSIDADEAVHHVRRHAAPDARTRTVPDLSPVRERFPGLAREQDGRPVVFADAPAEVLGSLSALD